MSISLNLPTERSAAVHGRIVQLDGLRAVAILAVLLNHAVHVPLMWAGVDVFFVLSGFLITGILLARKRAGGDYFSYFYRRRVFRILPAYIAALLAYGLIFGWTTFHPWPLMAFFGMNFQALYAQHPNPLPLWSLAVEEQFYLVWPVVILLVSERVLLWLAVAAVACTPLLRALSAPFFPSQFYIYMLTPFRADLLCAGAIMALLWKDRSPRFEQFCRKRAWIGFVFGFGALAFAQLVPILRLATNSRPANALDYSLSLIGSVSLLAWALADRSWLRRILSSRPMRFIGEISYTIYLIHLTVFLLIYRSFSSPWVMLLVGFALSALWATVSWFILERPLIRFAARLPNRNR